MAATPSPTSARRRGCLPFALGLLAVPLLALGLVVALSLTPAGRGLLGRAGTAWEILRGQTPSIDLDGSEDVTGARSEDTRVPTRTPALPQPESPLEFSSARNNEPPPTSQAEEPREPGPVPSLPAEIPAQPTWEPTRLFNGVVVETEVVRTDGGLAQEIRQLPEAYRARWQVEVTIPRPARSLDELAVATPGLEDLLPGLATHLQDASVSRVWHEMYRRKLHALGSSLSNLGEAPWRHNFFDLNTALEFTGEDGIHAFLMQADMDIVTDGSDGDRLPQMPEEIISARYYQSTTSYGWAKRSERENPLVERYRRGNREASQELATARAALADSPSEARRAELEETIAAQERRQEINERIIADLQARSYLIAEYDPFIVLPTWVITWDGQDDEKMPGIGDFAVVLHEGRAYPAIVGDAGPNQKVGEASLRLAREINPEVSQYRGAVDDLGITYLIFPGSAERPFGPPDYDHWHERCAELLASLGGLGEGYELHHWENLFPPLPGEGQVPTDEQEAGAEDPEPDGPTTPEETAATAPAEDLALTARHAPAR